MYKRQGLGYIEVGSFVSPKWVPQMAGSAEVFAQIQRKPGVTYGALAPNLRGFEDAMADLHSILMLADRPLSRAGSLPQGFCEHSYNYNRSNAMSLPTHVRIVEVGPRDGLQNEAQPISVADKVQLVDALTAAGLGYIEVGSFVSPKWVPQMAGSADVFAQIQRKSGVTYGALAPNLRGFEDAMAAGVKEVAVFAAASEAFSQRNINCSISESLERFVPIMDAARQHGVSVRGYVSCVLGCPYEGNVAPEQVALVARELYAMGCYEVSLGDTIGTGTAGDTRKMFEVVAADVPREKLAGHFHDTYGQAMANIYASLLEGISVFDSSIAGLGGCPYAKGASGNVATEDVVYLLNGLGIETGIHLDALILAGQQICTVLGRPTGSRVAKARSAQ